MVTEVHADIWENILSHLRNPIPLHLSNPPRSELRQPHLAEAALVCKEWNTLASKLLYTHVITDSLRSLVFASDTPSKLLSLSSIQSLHIEYSSKGEHPTYRELCGELQEDKWDRYGMTDEGELLMAIDFDCDEEMNELLRFFTMTISDRLDCLFPQLQSISVASLYQDKGRQWISFQGRNQHAYPEMCCPPWPVCRELFDSFLRTGPIKHVCIRNMSGPLCTDSRGGQEYTAAPGSITHTRTVHFNETDLYCPLSFGNPTKWISDSNPTTSWSEILNMIGYPLCSMSTSPARGVGQLDIYCSTNYYGPLDPFDLQGFASDALGKPMKSCEEAGPRLSEDEQHAMATELGHRVQRLFREIRKRDDVIKWHPASATPICPACGSGRPA